MSCAVQRGKDKALCPRVFGPLFQGTRISKINFLLVEGQQGARTEKGNKPHLITYKVRNPLKSVVCSLPPSPSASPDPVTWRPRGGGLRASPRRKILRPSSPITPLCPKSCATLHFEDRYFSPVQQTESRMIREWRDGCLVGWVLGEKGDDAEGKEAVVSVLVQSLGSASPPLYPSQK